MIRWRELVGGIEMLAENPYTTAEDIEAARLHLHPLLGTATLKPRDGVLWALPSSNAKSLVETKLSGRLHMNSQFLVAGARLLENVHLYAEPFPLVA